MARLIVLSCLAVAGWLALWPPAVLLTHSQAFTDAYLGSIGLPLDPLGVASGDTRRPAALALAAVFVWLAVVYVASLAVLRPSRWAVPFVIGSSAVYQVVLVGMPGVLSQDVFGYMAYGRLAAVYGLNPYVWPPSAIDKDPVVSWVAEVWRTYACPYGPLWLDVQTGLASVLGSFAPVQQAVAYRVVASVLLLACLALLWDVMAHMRRLDRQERLRALAALAWNPLVLLEVVGSAHNDALMAAFSLLALVPLTRRLPADHLTSGLCFTLGALVKYLSGLGLACVALAAAARARSWRARVGCLTLVVVASAALTGAVAAPWLEIPDSLEPLVSETASVGYVNALPDRLTLALADAVIAPAGVQAFQAREVARTVERPLALSMFVLLLAWEARRLWSEPTPEQIVRATARSSLVYVLVVSTSVQTWYFVLPLVLTLVLGLGERVTRVVLGYALLGLPVLYLAYYLREQTPEALYVLYALVPLLGGLSVQHHEPTSGHAAVQGAARLVDPIEL
jgi:hypothetical protein